VQTPYNLCEIGPTIYDITAVNGKIGSRPPVAGYLLVSVQSACTEVPPYAAVGQ